MLEDEDFQTADIFILPPEDATRSDEDSGPEDDDGHIDNLTGNQLRAEAEASVTVSGSEKKRLGSDDLDDDDGDIDISDSDMQKDSGDHDVLSAEAYGPEPEQSTSASDADSSTAKRRRRSATTYCASTVTSRLPRPKKTAPPLRQWVKCDLKQSDSQWNNPSPPSTDRTPSSVFELFYDDAVIDQITEMTNLYAMQKSKQLCATPSEIRLVIAVLLVSGDFRW